MIFIKQAKKEKPKSGEYKAAHLLAFGFAFSVFISSVTVLIFVTGCQPVKPEPIKAPKVEPAKAEPTKVEPTKVEPAKLEPAKAEPPKVEPPEAESAKVEAAKVEPPKVEPPEAEPAKAKPAKVEAQPAVLFHDKCANILKNYVNDRGMVDYDRLKRRRAELSAVLNEFAKLDPNDYNRWPKEDKIAFWINTYNMQTLKIIVANYPIQSYRMLRVFPGWGPYSIRHISRRIGGIDEQRFKVMDEVFTLREIEERFFRQKFAEPRVLLALCRATRSSPPLRNEPYYGDKLYQQLDEQAKRFLSSGQRFKIDKEKQKVYLSAVLNPVWHGKEFSSKYSTNKKFKDHDAGTRAVLNFVTNYVSKEQVSFLETGNYSIKYIKYDWRLNK